MAFRLSPGAYHSITAHAWAHLLAGGGIVPDNRGADLADTIRDVAEQHFDAKAADQAFHASLQGFDYEQRERISEAAWALIGAYQEAAFTLGAAVARQLHGGSPQASGRADLGGRQ
jgi:hypothetical protein